MGKLSGLADFAKIMGVLTPAGLSPLLVPTTAERKQKLEERKQKEETDKAEELKRSKESSGSDSETKATPRTYKAGGKVSSASKRADGIAVKGKTKGKYL
jgi:hypothetical protein